MLWLKTCPRCEGDLVRTWDVDGDAVVCCLQCGHRLSMQQVAALVQVARLTRQVA